jgi:hypothetical protein
MVMFIALGIVILAAYLISHPCRSETTKGEVRIISAAKEVARTTKCSAIETRGRNRSRYYIFLCDIQLHDNTRCLLAHGERKSSLTCDWNRGQATKLRKGIEAAAAAEEGR